MYFENCYSRALGYFSQAQGIAETTNNKLLEAECLERIASIYYMTNNPPLSLKFYYESLLIFEELNDSAGLALIYNALGGYNCDIGEYEKSKV